MDSCGVCDDGVVCLCELVSPFGGIRLLKICDGPQRRVDSVQLSVRLKPPCFSRVVDVINRVGRDRLVEMVKAKAVPGESNVSVYVSVCRVQEEGEAALKLHLHPDIRFRDLVQTYRHRKPDCQRNSFFVYLLSAPSVDTFKQTVCHNGYQPILEGFFKILFYLGPSTRHRF